MSDFVPDDAELVTRQARCLISCAIGEDEDGVQMVLADIREEGDIEAVALFLVGMISGWMDYFTENASEEWSNMMLLNAQLEEEGEANA